MNKHLSLPSAPDDALLPPIAGGDAGAFGELYRRRRADVYRFALYMTGEPAVAEDVVQDVFLVVMRDAGRYQPGRSGVAAWLRGIARNCARQRLDRERPFLQFPDDGLPGGIEPAIHPDPLDGLTRAEGVEMVRRAVLSLPLPYRETVVLCDLHELTYAEAAEALGCAVGTVRSRLHRGRELLVAKLVAQTEREPVGLNSARCTV